MGRPFTQETQEALNRGRVNFSRGRCDVLVRLPLIMRNDINFDFSDVCVYKGTVVMS